MITKKPKTPKRPKVIKKWKAKPGRKTTYRKATIDRICARLSKGEPLRRICRDEGMPDPATVWDWERKHPYVKQSVARAREAGYEAIAEETLDIADNASNDYMMGRFGPVLDTEHVQRSKIRIDTRLKLLACWSPRYNPATKLANADGGNLPETERVSIIQIVGVKPADG